MSQSKDSLGCLFCDEEIEYNDFMNEGRKDFDPLEELIRGESSEKREERDPLEELIQSESETRPADRDDQLIKLISDALGSTEPEKVVDERMRQGDLTLSEADDILAALGAAERESALILDDELDRMVEMGEISFPTIAETVAEIAKAKVEIEQKEQPAPKSLEEQKHDLLVQLVELKSKYQDAEIPREEREPLQDVAEGFSDEDRKRWRLEMQTYILMQADKPQEERRGVGTYLAALETFFDRPFGIKDSMLSKSTYILYGVLRKFKNFTLSRRGTPPWHTVTNVVKLRSAADRWLKEGNALENPEGQKLFEKALEYVNGFILSIRGWESHKREIIIDRAMDEQREVNAELREKFFPKTREEKVALIEAFIRQKESENRNLLEEILRFKTPEAAQPFMEKLVLGDAVLTDEREELKEFKEGRRELEQPPEITEQYLKGMALLAQAKGLYEQAEERLEEIAAMPAVGRKIKKRTRRQTRPASAQKPGAVSTGKEILPENIKSLLDYIRKQQSAQATQSKKKTPQEEELAEALALIHYAQTLELEARVYFGESSQDSAADSALSELIGEKSEPAVRFEADNLSELFAEEEKGENNE